MKSIHLVHHSKILYFFTVILLLSSAFCADPQNKQDHIRPPAVADRFYPGDPAELKGYISTLLKESAAISDDGHIYGMVVPHAGYTFSGKTAAAGYKQIQSDSYKLIVILAPSHRDPFQGASIYPGDAYKTPLGTSLIDKKTAQKLVDKCRYISFSENGHGPNEHSLEVQLPFIQTIFPDVNIVPIVIGQYNWNVCEQIGKTLADVIDPEKTLIIASSDLYHGYSVTDCENSDNSTLAAIQGCDPENFYNGVKNNKFQLCGSGPLTVLQIALKEMGATHAQIITRTNSAKVTGQKEGYVVGYGAVVFTKQKEHTEYSEIDKNLQNELLKLAGQAIKSYMETKSIPEFKTDNAVLNEKRGVFVTLTKNGQLRGCIGQHESSLPLYQLVPQMAVAAAFGDPRFSPLSPDELDEIEIKISVYLTNVYKINSIAEFKMGEHGIILKKNGRSATYLPEVPIQAGWKSVDEEMTSLCRKAGLPSNAWKNGAEFWVYRTQVFGENKSK